MPFVDVLAFGFPTYTEQQLMKKTTDHVARRAEDISHKEQGNSCIAAGYVQCAEDANECNL